MSGDAPSFLLVGPGPSSRPALEAAARGLAGVAVAETPEEAAMLAAEGSFPIVVATAEDLAPERWRPIERAAPSALAVLLLDGGDPPEPLPAAAVAVAASAAEARPALASALAVRERLLRLDRARRFAEEELERFVHVASHDLKAPLQGVLGLTGLLAAQEGPRMSADGQGLCDEIEGASLRLARMLDGLALYSRLGRGGLQPRTVRLEDLVDEVFAGAIGTFGGRVPHLDIAAPLPSIEADPDVLRAVLSALVDNALRYNESRPPRVTVAWVPDASGLGGTLTVTDNGLGLPPEALEPVFELFHRHHRDAGRFGDGAGCGLTLARRGAVLHGGDLVLQSREGAGTVARVRLPVPIAA